MLLSVRVTCLMYYIEFVSFADYVLLSLYQRLLCVSSNAYGKIKKSQRYFQQLAYVFVGTEGLERKRMCHERWYVLAENLSTVQREEYF
jgi:hypothetical protein